MSSRTFAVSPFIHMEAGPPGIRMRFITELDSSDFLH